MRTPSRTSARLLIGSRRNPTWILDRIAVIGGSYGGYMSLALAWNITTMRFAAGIDIVGISNFISFLKNTPRTIAATFAAWNTAMNATPDLTISSKKSRPPPILKKLRSPSSWFRAKMIRAFPGPKSQQMVATVRKNGTPVWFLMAKDEGHGFSKKKNVDYQFYATVLFIQQFLLN